jgi:pyridoxal phosphate enzyme (YggS family)
MLMNNIKDVYKKIAHAAMRAGRSPEDVKLIAVSKGVGAETIKNAVESGMREFGENRIQEAQDKIAIIKACLPESRVKWHLIGHLQKNKAKSAVKLFDMIHSVDSLELAVLIERYAGEAGKKQKIMLQVKLSDEESKYGILKKNIIEVLSGIRHLGNLQVEGLMTIPPYFDDPERVRPFFRELRELKDKAVQAGFELPGLSMGMSNDFEVAIEEGATMVRVGTAIFGERSY